MMESLWLRLNLSPDLRQPSVFVPGTGFFFSLFFLVHNSRYYQQSEDLEGDSKLLPQLSADRYRQIVSPALALKGLQTAAIK